MNIVAKRGEVIKRRLRAKQQDQCQVCRLVGLLAMFQPSILIGNTFHEFIEVLRGAALEQMTNIVEVPDKLAHDLERFIPSTWILKQTQDLAGFVAIVSQERYVWIDEECALHTHSYSRISDSKMLVSGLVAVDLKTGQSLQVIFDIAPRFESCDAFESLVVSRPSFVGIEEGIMHNLAEPTMVVNHWYQVKLQTLDSVKKCYVP